MKDNPHYINSSSFSSLIATQIHLNTLITKMFKVLIALSLFVAIQGQLVRGTTSTGKPDLIGGFKDRPELIGTTATQNMVRTAIIDLAQSQNILATPVNVLSVATQLVHGLNYRIVFTARSFTSDSTIVCTAKFFEQFGGPSTLSSVTCA